MAIKSGFFNSVNGDRVYNADDLNHFFEGIISDGVFKGYKSELKVEAIGGMNVRVLTGKAICLDKYINLTAALDLEIEGGNSLPRIDAVVINTNLEDRNGYIYIKKGTPASTPTPPTLYNNPNTKELAIAYINVSENATTITEGNITDKRSDAAVCGWVALTNVSATLDTYKNNVTLSAPASVVNLGISQFDANHDTVFVYKNGVLLEEVIEYLIEGTGSTAKVHLSATATQGTHFMFVVQHVGQWTGTY